MIIVAAFESPTVVAGLDDVAVMGQPIEQRGGHLGIAEHAGPFAEGEIGGDDDGSTLIESADEMEQQLAAGLGERQVAELVEDDEVHPGQMLGDTTLPSVAGLDLQAVDEADFSQLQAEIEATRPGENPGALLLNFLTLISPGGAEGEDVRSETRRVFEERCGPDNYAKMQAIEREFDDWRRSPDLDAGKTVAAILKHLGKFERTWIAAGQDFPDDGHFVSESFTIQELKDHVSEKRGE